MSKKIVIDPITRIEGHLRIEVVVDDNNVVTQAYSSSTLFRGLEIILRNRDPRDAGFLVQRICGVCTYSHYKAGIEAVEDALDIKIPYNASLVRSLISSSLIVHDHLVHFYTLAGLDWCDIISALKADPKKAAAEAFKYSASPIAAGEADLLKVQNTVKDFVARGDLGPFANGYWGNKTYAFSPEENLIVLSHYLKLLEVQRTAAELMAIFGGKNPHPQSLTVGGVTSIMDILDPSRLGEFEFKYKQCVDFIENAYYPDVIMAAKAYANEPSVLAGCNLKNFMSYREIRVGVDDYLIPTGIVLNGDITKLLPIDESKIEEEVAHSWYKYTGNKVGLTPYEGQTNPDYTGFIDGESIDNTGKSVKAKVLDTSKKYSWIKSPRYDKMPMEVGPLATIVVGLAAKDERITKLATDLLQATGLPIGALFSTLGRTAARCLEARLVAQNGLKAFDALIENLKLDTTTCAPYNIDNNKKYEGRYIGSVPRGMLSHWVVINKGVIENYQAVVPSTWNAGPEDAAGKKGPYETSLVGTKISDISKPLEVIRTIHSFDPCIACSVHFMDTKGNELNEYKITPSAMKLN